jgi:hypothetical protein
VKVNINAGTIGTNISAEVVHIGSREKSGEPESVRVLFLGVNPLDTTRLRLDEEIRAIDEALQRSKFRERIDLISQWAVRPPDLQSFLLRHKPNIVHFAGHGGDAGDLMLENDSGEVQAIPPATLRGLFGQLGRTIRCVLLNACFSRIQAEEIAEHVPCVVGMSRPVEDGAAIRFAAAFYEALGHGQDVKTAFELGRQRLDLPGSDRLRHARPAGAPTQIASNIPVLLGRGDASRVRLFDV